MIWLCILLFIGVHIYIYLNPFRGMVTKKLDYWLAGELRLISSWIIVNHNFSHWRHYDIILYLKQNQENQKEVPRNNINDGSF